MANVVILQEYVPEYRVPFFRELERLCRGSGVTLTVGAATAGGSQSARNDRATLPFQTLTSEREFRLLGRRLTVRNYPDVARSADLLILEQARRNLDAYRLLLPRSTRRGRLALWGHGADYVESRTAAERQLSNLLLRRADHFFGYTTQSVSHATHVGVQNARTTIVQNSIDTRSLSRELAGLSTQDRDQFASSHGLGPFTTAFIGGLDESKRINILLESVPMIVERNPSFRLLIAGDGVARGSVERLAASLPQVRYFGRATGRLKALILASARALVIPGRIGLVALEAGVARIPIITTQGARHAPEVDYLPEGATVTTSATSDSYAAGVLRVLGSQAYLDSVVEMLEPIADTFSTEQMAANFHNGIHEALAH